MQKPNDLSDDDAPALQGHHLNHHLHFEDGAIVPIENPPSDAERDVALGLADDIPADHRMALFLAAFIGDLLAWLTTHEAAELVRRKVWIAALELAPEKIQQKNLVEIAETVGSTKQNLSLMRQTFRREFAKYRILAAGSEQKKRAELLSSTRETTKCFPNTTGVVNAVNATAERTGI